MWFLKHTGDIPEREWFTLALRVTPSDSETVFEAYVNGVKRENEYREWGILLPSLTVPRVYEACSIGTDPKYRDPFWGGAEGVLDVSSLVFFDASLPDAEFDQAVQIVDDARPA
jgi:hypothetical protein